MCHTIGALVIGTRIIYDAPVDGTRRDHLSPFDCASRHWARVVSKGEEEEV